MLEHGKASANFGAELAQAQGATLLHRLDTQNPSDQPRIIEYWAWVLAGRAAIADFHQRGFLVPYFTPPRGEQPRLDQVLNLDAPRVPMGDPGDQVQPNEFYTVPLFSEYHLVTAARAEVEHRLALYDADLFLTRSDAEAFGERAQRCVREALACYRAELFLAAANMLGAASEAAWHEIAQRMAASGLASGPLTTELGRALPSIGTIQSKALDDLRRVSAADFRDRFGFERAALDGLGETTRFWREARNYGMHPRDEPDGGIFTQAALGLQLMGATEFLSKLAKLVRNA